MTTASQTLLAALGFSSILVFKTDSKKSDGSALHYRRPKDGKEGILAGYRIVVPDHDNVGGLGAKMKSGNGLDFIAAYIAIHGGEGETTRYLQLRLFPNDRKANDTHPVYRGFIEASDGEDTVRVADASAFLKTDKNGHPFMSVALQEPWVKPADDAGSSSVPAEEPVTSDDPF